MTKFNLGGVGTEPGQTTVNLVEPCDVLCDIQDVDSYCKDGSVEWFGLVHTLEHIPSQDYVQFLRDLHRKLAPGGHVEVVHTDVGKLLEMVSAGELPLRVARMPIFTPADRLRVNIYHQHFNMWSAQMLVEDFEKVGYRAETFNAGWWSFDQVDELFPEESQRYFGVSIPNLGVRAYK